MTSSPKPKPRRRRPVPEVTEELLERAALGYLERFDATARKLSDVLMRRVRKSAREHGTDIEAGRQMVEALVKRYRDSGLVSDRRYAEGVARGLRDRGGSKRAITAKLRARGVGDADLNEALLAAGVDETNELDAARIFARKRRLGPYRTGEARAAHARRDLSAMARAGFGFDVCRRVLSLDRDDSDGVD